MFGGRPPPGDVVAAEDSPHLCQVALSPQFAFIVGAPSAVAARTLAAAFVDAVSSSSQEESFEGGTAQRTVPTANGAGGQQALSRIPHGHTSVFGDKDAKAAMRGGHALSRTETSAGS